jgi:hypothetical protein
MLNFLMLLRFEGLILDFLLLLEVRDQFWIVYCCREMRDKCWIVVGMPVEQKDLIHSSQITVNKTLSAPG